MVLPYAENVAELGTFFQSANQRLAAGGKFVSVTLNPRFTKFQTNFFHSTHDEARRQLGKDGVHQKNRRSLGCEEPLFKRQYMEAEYEQAAAVAGMNVAWKSMTATPQAVAKEGEEFWRPIHETQPYILLIAQGR